MESLTLLYPPPNRPHPPPLSCFAFIVSIIVVIKHRKLTNYEPENRFVPSIYFPRCIVIMSIFSPIFHTKSLCLSRGPRLKSAAGSPLNRGCPDRESTLAGPWRKFGVGETLFALLIHYNQLAPTDTHTHTALSGTTGEVPTSASGYALLTLCCLLVQAMREMGVSLTSLITVITRNVHPNYTRHRRFVALSLRDSVLGLR